MSLTPHADDDPAGSLTPDQDSPTDTWTDQADQPARTEAQLETERRMRAAEVAVADHTATDEQRRLVEEMGHVRSRADRRAVAEQQAPDQAS